jgi:predicted AAA+ superfamily ATPase
MPVSSNTRRPLPVVSKHPTRVGTSSTTQNTKRNEKVVCGTKKGPLKKENKDENEILLERVAKMLRRHNTHLQRELIYAHRRRPINKPTVAQIRHLAATSLENYHSKQRQHLQPPL